MFRIILVIELEDSLGYMRYCHWSPHQRDSRMISHNYHKILMLDEPVQAFK